MSDTTSVNIRTGSGGQSRREGGWQVTKGREGDKDDAEERNATRSFVSFFLREGGGTALVPSYMLKIDTLFTFIIHMHYTYVHMTHFRR